MKELIAIIEEYIKIHASHLYWNGIHFQKSKELKKHDSATWNVIIAIEAMEKPIYEEIKAKLYYTDLEEDWLQDHTEYSDIWEYIQKESCRRAATMRQANNI